MKFQTLIITHGDMIDALQLYIDTIRKDDVVVTDLQALLTPSATTEYKVLMISGAEQFKNILKDGKD